MTNESQGPKKPEQNTPEETVPEVVPETTPETTPEKSVQESTAPASIKSESATAKKVVSEKSSGNGLVVASLVLSVVAIVGTAYLWQGDATQKQQLEDGRVDISGTSQRVDAQQQQLRELQRQLDRQTDESSQQHSTLNSEIEILQRKLASQQKRLISLSTTDRDDWLLAEAEYLMRLASQRLLMGKEINGALDLLKATDEIMVELDDSGLYAARQALAEDMVKLRAAGKFDLEGLYLKLAAAATQGDQLQLFALPQLDLPAVEPQQSADWQQRLQSGFAAAWEKLSNYIQIKKRDEQYKPLLSPEYEAAVRQNLHLMFEQAQMAALAGKQSLYQDSLSKANYWLNNYYTLDKSAAQALITTVDELATQKVVVTLPDISGSLRALKNYLEMLHEVKPTPVAVKEKASANKIETTEEATEKNTKTAIQEQSTEAATAESSL